MNNNLPSTWAVGHVGGRLLLGYYDLYHRLQLELYVHVMMGAMDTRNMLNKFAANNTCILLHLVGSY